METQTIGQLLGIDETTSVVVTYFGNQWTDEDEVYLRPSWSVQDTVDMLSENAAEAAMDYMDEDESEDDYDDDIAAAGWTLEFNGKIYANDFDNTITEEEREGLY